MTAQEIKNLRKQLGLTAKGLADLVGTTENTVYRWEMGIRKVKGITAKTLQRLRDDRRQAVPA